MMDFFIISRIKEITHLKHDKQIAELINLSPTDFNNRKKIGTLLPLLIDWGIHEKVNLHWLLTGEGDPYVYKEMKDIREVNNEYPAPPDPIDQIMQGFAQLFKDQKKENEKSHDLCNKVLRKFSDLEKKFKKMQPGAARRLNAGNAEAGSGSHAHYGDATRKKES